MKKLNIKKGDIFGNLKILKEVDKKGICRRFLVKCYKCGKEKEILIYLIFKIKKNLNAGCHCMRRKYIRKKPKKTYKENEIRLKTIWYCMRNRCNNVDNNQYKNYGGRGIIVSDEWDKSFQNFYNDMVGTYKIGLTLDRINSNGNYCKENCRWISNIENQRNKRNNIIIEGVTLPEFCEKYNLNYKLTVNRLKLNWSIEKIKIMKSKTTYSLRKELNRYIFHSISYTKFKIVKIIKK